jgi:hypothetical protein
MRRPRPDFRLLHHKKKKINVYYPPSKTLRQVVGKMVKSDP